MKARGELLARYDSGSLKMRLAAAVAQQHILQETSIREQARGIVGSMNFANACATPCSVDCRSIQSQYLNGYPGSNASNAVLPLAPASFQQVNTLEGIPTAPETLVRQVELGAAIANISDDVPLSEISTARFIEARATAEELVENMRLKSENEAIRQELNLLLAQTADVAPVGG